MVRSMTGYGTGCASDDGAAVSVEIRCGNHRYLDTHIRLGKEYAFLETDIAQQVREAISRGRIDINVTIQEKEPSAIPVNIAAAKGYLEAVSRMRIELGITGELDVQTLLLLPGVLSSREAGTGPAQGRKESYSLMVRDAVGRALEEVEVMRGQEGLALKADMLARLASLNEESGQIRERMPQELEEYRRRVEERLESFKNALQLDPQRLEIEVALLAEKSDISEELARLDSHLRQFGNLMESEVEVGKKLDFLLQEMQREINTVMAKAGSVDIKRLGIAIKAEIEKLREQVQNVE